MAFFKTTQRAVFQAKLLPSLLLPSQSCTKRSLYWILYSAANKIDEERIKTVGADRACAEWLVKCGASVRFHGKKKSISDYNKIGETVGPNATLAEVNADEATIMSIGFPHFKNVDEVVSLTFRRCGFFNDSCIEQLSKYCRHSVKDLHIASCGDVSDEGVKLLSDFSSLQRLSLNHLSAIQSPENIFRDLCSALPNCQVELTTDTLTLSSYTKEDDPV